MKINEKNMSRIKQNIYTLTLIVTCLVVSPFIFVKIWKTSAESKKSPIPKTSVSEAVPEKDAAAPVENVPTPKENSEPVTVQTDVSSAAEQEIVTTVTTAAEDESKVKFSSSDMSYFDDALFIGDSRTVGIRDYGTIKNADYFCDVGLTAAAAFDSPAEGVYLDSIIDAKQYGKIYIMLGINEVGNDFEYTMTQYRALVDKVRAHQPDAIIYIMANLHVTASAETYSINNEAINYLNSRMAELCDGKKVFYLDVNEVFDNEYGYLNDEYTSDGVHVYAEHYAKWCEWLCDHAVLSD